MGSLVNKFRTHRRPVLLSLWTVLAVLLLAGAISIGAAFAGAFVLGGIDLALRKELRRGSR